MEKVLDVYKRPYDAAHPVVGMDESPIQMIKETRETVPAKPGRCARYDYEYERCGVCNVFIAGEPLAGRRLVTVTERKTKRDWAYFIEEIAEAYHDAAKITVIMDNYNTHKPGSLYEVFHPEKAKALWDRFEFVYTPKHGSWLNVAEIELNVLSRQCLKKRMSSLAEVQEAVNAWQNHRNNLNAAINWRFTTTDARIKLRRHYSELESRHNTRNIVTSLLNR